MTTFTIKNSKGLSAEIVSVGASVYSLKVPDKDGNFADVVLGCRDLESYNFNPACFGSVVGRHANRIKNARFSLNGKTYMLEPNNGPNNLHSGPNSLHGMEFYSIAESSNSVTLARGMCDMEDGFPGNLDVRVTYSLTESNELKITYYALSDADTIINLTNHTYFNLAGHNSGSVENHVAKIDADFYLPCDDFHTPTGEIRSVESFPANFNFKETSKRFGKHPYDNTLVLNGKGYRKAAIVKDPKSGRKLTLFTDMPGVQLYTACNMGAKTPGKDGANYGPLSGFCLETQYFPNAVNMPWVLQPVFKAGVPFESVTAFQFSVDK